MAGQRCGRSRLASELNRFDPGSHILGAVGNDVPQACRGSNHEAELEVGLVGFDNGIRG